MEETAASGDTTVAPPSPPADAPPADAPPADNMPPPDALGALVERWWNDHFPGSPVAQVTQAWNHALAAKDELRRRLAAFIEGVR